MWVESGEDNRPGPRDDLHVPKFKEKSVFVIASSDAEALQMAKFEVDSFWDSLPKKNMPGTDASYQKEDPTIRVSLGLDTGFTWEPSNMEVGQVS